MRKEIPPLPAQTLANLFIQLKHLEKSGLSAEQAFNILSKDQDKIGERAVLMLSHIRRGKSLTLAGQHAGLFQGFDAMLLKIGEYSGNLVDVYDSLSRWHQHRARQIRTLKSKLLLPLLTFIVACFIQPITGLINGSLDLWGYLYASISPLFIFALLVFMLWRTPAWLREDGWLGFLGLDETLQQLQLSLPLMGKLYIRHQVRNFMYALALMLRAGMPILEALPRSCTIIQNETLQARFERLGELIADGCLLTDVLGMVKEINPTNVAMIKAGEAAGAMDNLILHWVEMETEDIELENAHVTAWLSRVFYGVVMLWMTVQILTGYPTPAY